MPLSTSSSSLLFCVLVKCAKIQSSDNECYSYVVLKIDNVKSTTTVVTGSQPSWEQEFYFDIPDCSAGLQIELWERGQLWDKLLGLSHLRLDRYDNQLINTGLSSAHERWLTLDAELILNRQGQIARTCHPTGHSLLIRTYVELPSDLTEEESKEITEKLEILHDILDKEGRQLQDITFDEINSISAIHNDQRNRPQCRQLSNRSHSHFSDDSDYTSDVSYSINSQVNINYPVTSMSQSNAISSINEDLSPIGIPKKPLAFVQPVVRDLSRRSNLNPIERTKPINQQEPLSYVSQARKMTAQLPNDQKFFYLCLEKEKEAAATEEEEKEEEEEEEEQQQQQEEDEKHIKTRSRFWSKRAY
ncbi:unnamed protein product [Rotaria socialis]|uniref:C2 domain-containing protein n=1 Tax=Rotaria socialis TaxID=392032 RepID=A0A820AAG3_9BILA|nr:unnamed protein product [Rotaria socialis]CAF4186294.1 unnamed protein product [Rotaria socialis]